MTFVDGTSPGQRGEYWGLGLFGEPRERPFIGEASRTSSGQNERPSRGFPCTTDRLHEAGRRLARYGSGEVVRNV